MTIPRSILQPCRRAFSLVELLVVVSIAMILMALSGPLVSALSGAGTVNKASADLAGTLELGRSYAMSHQTYVRMAIGEVASTPESSQGSTVVLTMFSADGTLTRDSNADMASETTWPTLGRALVLDQFSLRDALNIATPDTTRDALPSESNLAGAGQDLEREVPGLGEVKFTGFIQFQPNGQAYVLKETPARHVKLALDKRGTTTSNPIVLRMSGSNGNVRIFRQEDGIR